MQSVRIKECIRNAQKILITSHINCDQDGICSALATKLIIKKNFKNKEILINIESQLQRNIYFLKDFTKIKTENLYKKIEEFKPDLIIFTDSSSISRFTLNPQEVLKTIKKNKIKTVLIDHHHSETDFYTDIKYNNHRSSCAEEVYKLFVRDMNLDIDRNIAEIILTGMIFDTGVFSYKNEFFRETANIVADIVEMGISVEKIITSKNIYVEEDFCVFTELNKNLVLKEGFSYSYITDKFKRMIKIEDHKYKRAYHSWVDLFLKNIEKRPWGFIIRPEKDGEYSVTFRSQEGSQNVRILAEKLGGGGHDHASGAKLKAKNIDSVIEKILNQTLQVKRTS